MAGRPAGSRSRLRRPVMILRPRTLRRRRGRRNPSPRPDLLRKVPSEVLVAAEKIRQAGRNVRTNLVGGSVADLLSNRPVKDWDIEVFGLTMKDLLRTAKKLGKAEEVGKAFGVVKLYLPSGLDLDLSVPRRDNRVGKGHKGIEVVLDPNMTYTEAARRRDFTINSMALTFPSGELIDPFGGLQDLKEGVLRATDPKLFVQDPLRGLRAMQLLARKAKVVHPDTMRLIKSIKGEYKDLPPERAFEEWRKLLMKSKRPSVGLQFLQDSRWIENFPELAALPGVPQSPKWHPEGDVWEHTKLTTDAAAKLRPYVREEYREPFMFGAMLHDVGKAVPGITVYPEDVESGEYPADRLYTAYGHDEAGRSRARSFMESLKAQKRHKSEKGTASVGLVGQLVGLHMQPSYLTTGGAGKGAWARLARKVEAEGGDLRLLARIKQADDGGSVPWGERNFPEGIPDWDHPFSETALRWADEFEKAEESAVKPMVLGRDLMDLGYSPGPNFSTLLKKALALQDSGLGKEEILEVLTQQHPPSSAPSRAPKTSRKPRAKKSRGERRKEVDEALGGPCPQRMEERIEHKFCRDLRTKYRREYGEGWWQDEKTKAEYKADLREGYKKIKARSH